MIPLHTGSSKPEQSPTKGIPFKQWPKGGTPEQEACRKEIERREALRLADELNPPPPREKCVHPSIAAQGRLPFGEGAIILAILFIIVTALGTVFHQHADLAARIDLVIYLVFSFWFAAKA